MKNLNIFPVIRHLHIAPPAPSTLRAILYKMSVAVNTDGFARKPVAARAPFARRGIGCVFLLLKVSLQGQKAKTGWTAFQRETSDDSDLIVLTGGEA